VNWANETAPNRPVWTQGIVCNWFQCNLLGKGAAKFGKKTANEMAAASEDNLRRRTNRVRLVAVKQTHGLTEILTFNTVDFARFSGIVAIDPATV
jgi:hypothetical protein